MLCVLVRFHRIAGKGKTATAPGVVPSSAFASFSRPLWGSRALLRSCPLRLGKCEQRPSLLSCFPKSLRVQLVRHHSINQKANEDNAFDRDSLNLESKVTPSNTLRQLGVAGEFHANYDFKNLLQQRKTLFVQLRKAADNRKLEEQLFKKVITVCIHLHRSSEAHVSSFRS